MVSKSFFLCYQIHDASFTEFLFTWREKRQDIVPEPLIQEEHLDTCLAIALFRGQSALVRINGSDRALLTLAMLLVGVDSRYQSESHAWKKIM
ncbi:unnamed protein product [Brassica rapa]|uniref:Uncharacterized protein n=1 Tax=Brassica campestris TaxID=3711 RepID=A0A8D9GBH2_BRACM|nr:unnamed protein product [Brassica rapa]